MRLARGICKIAVLMVTLLVASTACSTTILVPWDHPSIGAAISAAADGDTVLVHPGVYAGVDNRAMDFAGKNLVLVSAGGAEVTMIDCENVGRALYFHTGEDSTSVVAGFTIMNGAAHRGGGIHCGGASPIIDGCIFESNSALEAGGGVYCVASGAKVRNCEFNVNIVTTSGFGFGGGGMHCNACSPAILACEFNGNSASSGGGLYCAFVSSPSVQGCVFKENLAHGYHGGGLFCYDNSTPTVSGCDFILNDAERNGGGIYCEDSSPDISLCTFQNNEVLAVMSDFGGGGICLVRSAPTVTECEFEANYAAQGGGVSCRDHSHPSVLACTFVANTAHYGAGLFCIGDSQPQIVGSLFDLGVASAGGGLFAWGANPWASGCTFAGNTATGEYQGGGAVCIVYSLGSLEDCAFVGNDGLLGGALHVGDNSVLTVSGSTLAGNSAAEGSGAYCTNASLTLGNCILAFGYGEAVACFDELGVVVTCTDVFGNSGGDWTGCIAPLAGVSGNISLDPLFCGGGDIAESYMLRSNSPCSSDNSPCGQMGRWGVGCPATPVEPRSWGGIKAMYR